MRKINPGKDVLVSFLEEVEKDKLAHPRPDNAKKLGAACKAKQIDDEPRETEEDVVDTMNKKTGIDFKQTKNSMGKMDEAAFSRQHYQAIAEILKDASENSKRNDRSGVSIVNEIAEKLVELFLADNERFDTHKFMKAAGLATDRG